MANGIEIGCWMAVIGPGIVNKWERNGYAITTEIPVMLDHPITVEEDEIFVHRIPLEWHHLVATGDWEFRGRIRPAEAAKLAKPVCVACGEKPQFAGLMYCLDCLEKDCRTPLSLADGGA